VREGVDGSGKTTQARLLAEWYRERGMPVCFTREPGGTALGERLRSIILDPAVPCEPRAELLMIEAARAQHVAEVIAPALRTGVTVISDRFSLSSLAYQGFGRGLALAEIMAADRVATGEVQPSLTLVINVSLDTALARIGERQDRFEGEGRTFLQRVVDGYLRLATADPRVLLVDGNASVEAVQRCVREAVYRLDAVKMEEAL